MRRISLLTMMCCIAFLAVSQKKAPKWMEKQRKAIISITTYGKDNKVLHTGNGFFISESGEALAGYSLFKGAERATATDTEGKTYPVTTIMGADGLYDVIKIQVHVPKKIPFFSLATEPLANGSNVYLVLYTTEKTATFKEGTVTEVSKLKDPYSYYKTSIALESAQWINAPLLTEEGRVVGLMQEDAAGKKDVSYAVSAGYVNSLEVNSMSLLSATYTDIGIRKAWPKEVEQAQISLFLLKGSQDAKTYLETINDFIAAFPHHSEGYQSRASLYAYSRAELAGTPAEEQLYLDRALEDLNTAAQYIPKKSDALYNRARLIFDIANGDTTITDKNWTVAAAMTLLQEAIDEEDSPVYRQLEGDMFFSLGAYEPAYESYMKVTESDMASASSYYLAAKAKENIPGTNISDIIALLDKAIDMGKENPTEDTFAYLLERIDFKMKLTLYEEAITDYDLYAEMLGGRVNHSFYYYREQAKFRMGDFAGALADIQEALKAVPLNPNYLAEEASVYIRLEKYPEALQSIDKAIEQAPDFASCYRLKGVAYVRTSQKNKACEAFQKAQELGDPVVARLIKEHCGE